MWHMTILHQAKHYYVLHSIYMEGKTICCKHSANTCSPTFHIWKVKLHDFSFVANILQSPVILKNYEFKLLFLFLEGIDFVAVDTTLTFGPDVTMATHTVFLLDDEISEGLENFELQLVLVDPALGDPGVIATASVAILDNEGT